jgi:Cu/Ag efflux protein CusF
VLLAASLLFAVGAAHHATAQPAHPTMTNIIPDGGTGAIQGRVQAMDPDNRQITIVSSSNAPTTFVVAPHVRLDDIKTGDSVSAQYSRTVFFVITGRGAQAPAPSTTVEQFAHTPGGIPPEGLQLAGTVIKVDAGHSFDVVNPTGGGVYTVQVTNPQRIAMLSTIKVGDTVAVSVSPLTVDSLTECGFFGCS